MIKHCARSLGLLGVLLLTAASAAADDLPRIKGRAIAARVQGEPITLAEVERQLGAAATPTGTAPDRAAQLAVLDRMINVVLIAQEAKRMGLDKLPDVRKALDAFARVALRDELVEHVVKDVKFDPREVDEVYRASVREWTITAVLFAKNEDAQALAAEIAAGKRLADVAPAYLAAGRAAKLEPGAVVRRETTDPAIVKAVAGMAVGATSPVITTRSGPVIVTLDEVRHPDNPAARAAAERIVLTNQRKEAVTAFDEALKKKYVTIRAAVLAAVDYDAEQPGIEALLKDKRIVAEIKGEPPVTVGELTEQLKFQFFHGTTLATERKRLNARKAQVLDGILHRKVFRREALRRKIDRTDGYLLKLKEHEQATLFDLVVRKVIAPGVRMRDEDVKAYYATHREQYTSPEMIRMKSLVFADRGRADTALDALRKGADFRWVADRADDQVDRNAKGVLSFDGRPIMVSELPDGVRHAVASARNGDVRLYASPDGRFYVLAIDHVIPASPQPYEQARSEIARKLYDAEIQKAVREYADKLRGLSDVKVYLTST